MSQNDGANQAKGKPSMVAIGEKLREAREKKALTVDQVQKKTLIHSQVIKALEDGTCDNMLTATYVKSFLRKYANFLNLDPNEILKEYNATKQEPVSVTINTPVNKANVESARKAEDNKDYFVLDTELVVKIALGAVAVFILASLIFLIMFAGSKIVSFINKPKPMKPVVVRTQKPKAKAATAARPQTAKATTQKKIVAAKPVQAAAAPIAQKRVEAQPQVAAAATSKDLVQKGTPLFLVLKTKQPVLVKVREDGVSLFERVLPKGSVESFIAMEKIEIYVAKAEAVELTLNDKPLAIPGKGLVRNMEITRQGIRLK